jgi:general secretion pathway protein D
MTMDKRASGFVPESLRVGCLALLLLAGCAAGYKEHRDGLALLAQGRPDEAAAMLAAATEAAPENLAWRADLLRAREQATRRLVRAADTERSAGRLPAAKALYERVLAGEPDNAAARLGVERVDADLRARATLDRAEALLRAGDVAGAAEAVQRVLLEEPHQSRAGALQRQVNERLAARAAEPTLSPQFAKPVTLQFRDANLKLVFESLSRLTGINVILDREVRSDLKTTIFVSGASVADVIDLIALQNQLARKIVSSNTVFVYPATPAKLKEYQDLKIRSFHLTHADPKQILTMLKTLLKTRDVFVHERTNSVVIRDTPDAVRLAEKLVADQDLPPPEVMLEVEVLEVSTTRLSELGIRWPGSIGLSTPATAATLGDVRALNADDLLVTPLSATLNLRLEDGDTNVLASPRIRVRNREKAKIMIGSRVPVITNAVTPVSTGTPVVTGSVQYLDVGLKLDVEPDITQDEEVVIKVGLDVSSIVREVVNQQSGSLAYEIGTRNAMTVLRLRDGETQVLAGLISDEERRTATKVPGLGDIPVVGPLFGSQKRNGGKTEIVLSITPRIVGSPRVPDGLNVEYWAGTEFNVRNGLLNLVRGGHVAIASVVDKPADAPAAADAHKGAGAALFAWQGPARVRPRERFGVALNFKGTQPVGRIEAVVTFDPGALKVLDVTEGPPVQQAGAALSKTIDQAGGRVDLDIAGRGGAAAKGAGTLATILFEAVSADPEARIALDQIVVSGPDGEPLASAPSAPHVVKVAP